MNIPNNRAYGIAMTGVALIAATLLCGAALSEAHDRPAQPAAPHVSVDAKSVSAFDPATIEIVEGKDALHVQLKPGTATMHLTVVDNALAAKPARIQPPPVRRAPNLE